LVFEVVVTHDPRERGPYKYTVDVPALPGCFGEGRSREEALGNIQEAITLFLVAKSDLRVRRDSELVEVAL
jgi:predicted RNase H-like HicB family nuclease